MVDEKAKIRVEDFEKMHAEIDPTKDYFDATGSILAIAESHRQMANRMAEVEKLLQLQGEINGKLLTQLGLLSQRVADMDEPSTSGLILPERLTN